MPDDALKDRLRLPELSIRSFRGLNDLTLPKLGRVTLIAGKNGVGKTAVLDAIRVYAARGDYSALLQVLQDREEASFRTDGDDFLVPDWNSLFFGRDENSCILIGPSEEERKLKIEIGFVDEQIQQNLPAHLRNRKVRAIKVEIEGKKREFPLIHSTEDLSIDRDYLRWIGLNSERLSKITCNFSGPDLLSKRKLARFWNSIALTDDEGPILESLTSILGHDIEGIAVLGEERSSNGRDNQRIMVKSANHASPVPLNILGDGAARVFSTALALVCSRNGFLLVDEVENGIHHAALYEFWRMVLTTAKQNNVQVFATTHGWDCVVRFAQAAKEIGDDEGSLIRLDEKKGSIRAVHYSVKDLEIAASLNIEVR